MSCQFLQAVRNRPYCEICYVRTLHRPCAFVLASYVVRFLSAKQLLFFQSPYPSFHGFLPFPLSLRMSATICLFFPHRSYSPLHLPHQVHCSYNPTAGNRFGQVQSLMRSFTDDRKPSWQHFCLALLFNRSLRSRLLFQRREPQNVRVSV